MAGLAISTYKKGACWNGLSLIDGAEMFLYTQWQVLKIPACASKKLNRDGHFPECILMFSHGVNANVCVSCNYRCWPRSTA